MQLYDYTNQAWVKDGKYIRCGHPESMNCGCYGRIHAGTAADIGNVLAQNLPPVRGLYDAKTTIDVARRAGGFLTLDEVEAIAKDPATRLTPILVRCGCGRFTAPADQVLHFVRIIERDAKTNKAPLVDSDAWMDSDYIRDLSLAVMAVRQ